jgi:hypothetical protein
VGADLPREHLVGPVVVEDGGGGRGVGVQGDGGQRSAILPKASDELAGQVLRLGGAAPVAAGQQPAAASVQVAELVGPLPHHRHDVGEPAGRARQGGEVVRDRIRCGCE